MLLFCCSPETEKKEKKTITNPNGDSELALNMREIFDQTKLIKESIHNGKLVIPENYIQNIKAFHTSVPTDPEVKVDLFFQFTDVLEATASELSKQNTVEEQEMYYKRVVNTCIQCHQSFCPGPIRRINKLKLSKKK